MKRRLITLALAVLLCLELSLPALADASSFLSHRFSASYSDISDGHWSADGVERAATLGIFHGIGNGLFGRGQPITRAAFVTAMVRLFGWKETLPERDSFSDVTADRWFYRYVETAKAHGAIAVSDHAFRPTDDITREDMAAMLVRGLGYTSLAGVASGYESPFSDITSNKGFIIVAHDLGIVDGVGEDRFDPTGTATREQAAAVLVRVHDQLSAASTQLSAAGDYRLITISTPIAQAGDEMPITPLEPLPELYATLRRMKTGGDDMSGAALRLMAGGVRTITDAGGSPVAGSELISAKEVQKVLENKDAAASYSERYESAYCIYAPNAYQTATVWYQSEESMAAKLRLARLFGVTRYVLE